MRISLQKANAAARYEWVAVAGLVGFNTPRPFEGLTDLERRRRRADDLIDRKIWNAFVQKCLSEQSGAPCDTTPLTAISNPLTFYNGQPIAPADSTFLGRAGIQAYGADVILGNGASQSIKNAGAQRCYANEYVMTWALDLPAEEYKIYSAEHLQQCAEVRNPTVDALYASVPGYPGPLPPLTTTTTGRRAANPNAPGQANKPTTPPGQANNPTTPPGQGNNSNNNTPPTTPPGQSVRPAKKPFKGQGVPAHMRRTLEKTLDALKTDCSVDTKGSVSCPLVYFTGDAKVIMAGQATPAQVTYYDTDGPATPEFKSVVKTLTSGTCTVVSDDGSIESSYDCAGLGSQPLPAAAKSDKVAIVGADGQATYLPSDMVDSVISRLSEHFRAEMSRQSRRRAGDSDPEYYQYLSEVQEDCLMDVFEQMRTLGAMDDPSTRCPTLRV